MRILLGTLIFTVFISFSIIAAPMASMVKSENIDWYFFKRIKLGKLSFLFDFKNKMHIKEDGIITPYFLSILKAYVCVIIMIILIAIYFIFYFKSIETIDKTLPTLIAICVCIDLLLELIITITAEILCKKRKKDLDKQEYKNVFKK